MIESPTSNDRARCKTDKGFQYGPNLFYKRMKMSCSRSFIGSGRSEYDMYSNLTSGYRSIITVHNATE